MALNGSVLNGSALNGTVSAGETFTLPGFDATTMTLSPLGQQFRLGGPTTEYSVAGVFFWNASLECTLEHITAANQPTVFNSIRDDGNCNRLQYIRDKCLGIVEVCYSCNGGDEE